MAAKYYQAPALVTLNAELNKAYPSRDKTSDGWIGDPSHAARKSDHNPDYSAKGVVRARDIDKDGIDCNRLLQILIQDRRTNYVIFNGFIYSRQYGFKKRVYTGTNKHTKHLHVSLRHGTQYENSTTSWGIADTTPAKTITGKGSAPAFPLPRGSYFGPKEGGPESVSGYFSFGASLAQWQAQMQARGWAITPSGRYDSTTEKVAGQFQAEKGLKPVDKLIGPATWKAAWESPTT